MASGDCPDKTLLAEVYTELEKGRRLQEVVSKLDDIKMSGFKVPTNWKAASEISQGTSGCALGRCA